MSKLTRFAFAFLAFLGAIVAPLSAYTVDEMKAMETKVKQLVAKNTPSVVSLIGEKVKGAGSGTIVSADGIILTAAHVTKGNDYMIVVFPDGKHARCKVLGADYARDVSLTKIEQPGTYPFVEVGDSDKLETTTIVIAMGHPGGYDLRRTPPVRIGRISNTDLGGYLLSDCTLISGDSGGPLFDLDGKVVGVHSSISTSLSYNRCAPVNAAKASWTKLLAGEKWGKLGGLAGLAPDPEDNKAVIGAQLDPESENGAAVLQVYPKSPLETAGLKAADVITRIGSHAVKSADELIAELGNSKPGDQVELAYQRSGVEQKATVTLVSRDDMNKIMGLENSPFRGRRRGGGPNGAKPSPR